MIIFTCIMFFSFYGFLDSLCNHLVAVLFFIKCNLYIYLLLLFSPVVGSAVHRNPIANQSTVISLATCIP